MLFIECPLNSSIHFFSWCHASILHHLPLLVTTVVQLISSIFQFSQNASISLRYGADAWAPKRVTLLAAAALLIRNASCTPLPSANAAAKAPLNVSPAAVVSMAPTLSDGTAMKSVPS